MERKYLPNRKSGIGVFLRNHHWKLYVSKSFSHDLMHKVLRTWLQSTLHPPSSELSQATKVNHLLHSGHELHISSLVVCVHIHHNLPFTRFSHIQKELNTHLQQLFNCTWEKSIINKESKLLEKCSKLRNTICRYKKNFVLYTH